MYYPKSQVKTNLFTNGGEYALKSNNKEYVGYYWVTSTGKIYTGKTPTDLDIRELVVLNDIPLPVNAESTPNTALYDNDFSNSFYNAVKQVDTSKVLLIPSYYLPQPTPQDYQLGEFQRYFCKKSNEALYIETNKETFDKLIAQDPDWLWQLYQPFSLSWQISGDKETVAKTNRNIVLLTMNKFRLPQFNLYLRNDYLKFYK